VRYQHAAAYYGVIREPLVSYGLSDEQIAELAIKQEQLIEANKITDWANNLDVQKKIKRQLDRQFYDVEQAAGAQFDLDQVDAMIEQVVDVAKARDSYRA
jgi:hypothetical protein